MTAYQLHVQRWKDCRECPLCEGRSRVVLCRGSLPCDVLFVGEAPGESEDAVGLPFVGPAGQLLDHIVEQALSEWAVGCWDPTVKPNLVKMAFTNIVACIPRDDDGGKAGQPPVEAIMACKGRLREMVEIASPRLMMCVGKMAWEWTDWIRSMPRVQIDHPAFILRMPAAVKGLKVQRAIVTLRTAVEEMMEGKTCQG